MQANQNKQSTGGCIGFPGEKYVVRGQTFRYRRYLRSIGLSWASWEPGWVGELSSGRAWYLRDKLGLDVERSVYTASEPMKRLAERMGIKRVAVVKPVRHRRRDRDDTVTWEHYSASPVATMWDARVREGLNINERRCRWGSSMCSSCMECVSNINENDVAPHPELDFWDSQEERERANAALGV